MPDEPCPDTLRTVPKSLVLDEDTDETRAFLKALGEAANKRLLAAIDVGDFDPETEPDPTVDEIEGIVSELDMSCRRCRVVLAALTRFSELP